MTLFGELTDQKDGRLTSQNSHLVGVWMSGSLSDQRLGELRKQNNHLLLANIS